jgi:hypothetical protein
MNDASVSLSFVKRIARRGALAGLIAVLLASAGGAAQEPATPFQSVDGDGWITSNAHFDGANWNARTANRPSFGLQLGEANDIPFEHGTAGASFWVRDAGCSGPFATFGKACGWKLALAITQYRALVVGGNGIEIDGLSLEPPYGRVLSASDGTSRRFGISNNIFADWSGADVATAPRWFAGFNITRDRFEIARGMTMSLSPLATVDADGRLGAALVSTGRIEQTSAQAFATRAHLTAGRYRFAFDRAYAHVPVCVASSEGLAPVHVQSTPAACTVISSDPADTSIVNVQTTGDPD